MSKYLVTGANGFIGKALTTSLLREGNKVASIDKASFGDNKVISYIGDITDENFIKKSLEEFLPDYIIHLAAQKVRSSDSSDFSSIIDNNLKGSFNLFNQAAKLQSLKKIIFVGTAEEYGLNKAPFSESMREDPISFYSFSKVCGTHLAQLFHKTYKLPVIIVRPSIAYGPGQGQEMFIPALVDALRKDKIFEMTTGEQARQFIYIEDLVLALEEICKNLEPSGQVINVSAEEQFTIKEVALSIAKTLGKENLLSIGSYPSRTIDIKDYRLDISYLKNKLAWKPKVSFERGIQLILK